MTLNIPPTAQMRARATSRGKFAHVYKASKQRANEKEINDLLKEHVPDVPYDCPLRLVVMCHMPIPRSWPTWKTVAALEGHIRHTGKPDMDNMVKQIKDCMEQVGFFRNDSQIYVIYADKKYSNTPDWDITLIPECEPKNKKEYDAMRGPHK